MNEQDKERFWQARARARRKLDRRLTALPFEEKLKIMKQMQAAHNAMPNAKRLT